MFSPVDKRQEYKLVPVECQQEEVFRGFGNGKPFTEDTLPRAMVFCRIPFDEHSWGVAAYACHKRFNLRNSGITLQGAA
jgi:hypothetical protein